jgi:hypothetical protein
VEELDLGAVAGVRRVGAAVPALVVVFSVLDDPVDGTQGEGPLQRVDVIAVLFFQAAQNDLQIDREPTRCPPRMLVSVLESHAPGDEGGVSEIRARRRARHEPLRDAVADGEELHEIPRNAASISRIKHRMDYLRSQPDPLHDRCSSCERRSTSPPGPFPNKNPTNLIGDTLECALV